MCSKHRTRGTLVSEAIQRLRCNPYSTAEQNDTSCSLSLFLCACVCARCMYISDILMLVCMFCVCVCVNQCMSGYASVRRIGAHAYLCVCEYTYGSVGIMCVYSFLCMCVSV